VPSRVKQRRKKQAIQARQTAAASAPPDAPWAPAFFKTTPARSPAPEEIPARHWLTHEVPKPVRIMMIAIINSVVAAPPSAFRPSNYWHAMHDDMAGIHEARDEHDGSLYRLFCVVDRAATQNGIPQPLVALLGGGIKADNDVMDAAVYSEIRGYRDIYVASNPRQIVLPPGVE